MKFTFAFTKKGSGQLQLPYLFFSDILSLFLMTGPMIHAAPSFTNLSKATWELDAGISFEHDCRFVVWNFGCRFIFLKHVGMTYRKTTTIELLAGAWTRGMVLEGEKGLEKHFTNPDKSWELKLLSKTESPNQTLIRMYR